MLAVTEIRRWARAVGPRTVGRLAWAQLVARVAGAGHRMHTKPSLDDMLDSGRRFHVDAEALLVALGFGADDVAALRGEFDKVLEELRARREELREDLPFPVNYGVEEQTGFFLYGGARLLQPEVVVETGVANGESSFLLLRALRENGRGSLVSFDIVPSAGVLVTEREQWRLVIAGKDSPEARFKSEVEALSAPIDLFFHDANHQYLPQLAEYRVVWPRMRRGGVFASDDVDDSRAFFEVGQRYGLRPELLFDKRKVTGAYRLPE